MKEIFEKIIVGKTLELGDYYYKFNRNGSFSRNYKGENIEGYYSFVEKDSKTYLITEPQVFPEKEMLLEFKIGQFQIL